MLTARTLLSGYSGCDVPVFYDDGRVMKFWVYHVLVVDIEHHDWGFFAFIVLRGFLQSKHSIILLCFAEDFLFLELSGQIPAWGCLNFIFFFLHHVIKLTSLSSDLLQCLSVTITQRSQLLRLFSY